MKEISSRWANLDAEAKLPYKHMAAQDKQRFEIEMNHYNSTKDCKLENDECKSPKDSHDSVIKLQNNYERMKTTVSPHKDDSVSEKESSKSKHLNPIIWKYSIFQIIWI